MLSVKLWFTAAFFNFEVRALHVPGRCNQFADCLSRWYSDPSGRDLYYCLCSDFDRIFPFQDVDSACFSFEVAWLYFLFFLVNFPGGSGSHLSAAVSHVTLGSFVFCLITMAHAISTQKNIIVHIGGYQTFCALTILQSFPMRVKSISLYIAGLVTWNRASGTILNHLSSLKRAHQIAGYELTWSSNYHYQLLLRGTKLF